MCIHKLPEASKKGEAKQLRQITAIACTTWPGCVLSLLLFLLISRKNYQEIILNSAPVCVHAHVLYAYMCVWPCNCYSEDTHKGESGWPWIFTLYCTPYGHKTGQRNLSWRGLNWSCLQKAFISSEMCYFLFLQWQSLWILLNTSPKLYFVFRWSLISVIPTWPLHYAGLWLTILPIELFTP